MSGGAKKRPTRYANAIATTPAALTVALRAHRKGELLAAANAYREALEHDAGLLDAWMNLGAVCVILGRAREAERAFVHALAIGSDNGRAHRDAGIGLASLGRFDLARAAFERALGLDASLLGARLALSRVCAQSGDRDGAVRFAREAVDAAPGDPSAQLELHRALFDDRAMGLCLRAVERAVALDPAYALARFFHAGALAWAGEGDRVAAALGPAGLVSDAMRDALGFVTQARTESMRSFAVARDTLHAALDEAMLDGPVLEFGVRHGISTRVLAEHVPGEIHGFDSFTGLPEAWQGRTAGAFSTAGERPELPPNVTLHVGWFEDTLPGFVREMTDPPRLIHVDSDLYSSARTVLVALGPAVRPGCVLVFDEFLGNARWREDEFRAFHEAAGRFGWAFEYRALCWITGQAVIRIRAAG